MEVGFGTPCTMYGDWLEKCLCNQATWCASLPPDFGPYHETCTVFTILRSSGGIVRSLLNPFWIWLNGGL